MRVPAQGSLEAVALPRLLVKLDAARFEGGLVLERNRTRKRFVLREGAPILGESNLASETLGVVLLDQGHLTREDYARVVARVQETSCREGKALLDLKLLDPKGLFDALKEQLRRRVLECFGWPAGTYALEPGDDTPAEALAFRVDPLALVQEGLALHWSPERLFAELGERLSLALAPTARLASIVKRLRPEAALTALVDALDGTRTLAQAVGVAAAPNALAIAWVLDATGALAVRTEASPAEAPADEWPVTVEEPAIEVVVSDDDASQGAAVRPGARAAQAPLGAEASALRDEILARRAKMEELDHYGLLGVAKTASAADVKRAYFQAAKRYHPDALARLGLGELRGPAGELFARIAKAYGVLGDPDARRDFDREGDAASEDEAQRIATAETLYRKAEILVRKGAFREALQFLQPAVDLWPDEAEYRCALGWALYKQPKADPEAAREQLQAAVKLDAKSAVAHFRLGTVLRALGDAPAAEKAFARAKSLDPKVANG